MGEKDVRDGKRRGFFSIIQGCLDPEVLLSAHLHLLGGQYKGYEQYEGKQHKLPIGAATSPLMLDKLCGMITEFRQRLGTSLLGVKAIILTACFAFALCNWC